MEIRYSEKISRTAPYAFAEIDRKVAELRASGVEVIDFGVGDPLSPTPEFVRSALQPAANERRSSGYPSYIGEASFRQACAEYLRRTFAVDLNPEKEISSTVGSKEAVFHLPLAFVNPGEIVICPTPGYPVYKTGTQFAGGQVYPVPLTAANNFLIDLDAIPAEIAEQAKMIWTNYPNSPTGAEAPRAWLEKLVAWAQKYNVIIAADEGCYIDIYLGQQRPLSILELARDGIITFYSLSKRNNMTGYRVGFVAGDERIVDGFKKVKTNIDSGTPTFIQDVAAQALADDQHVETMRAEYRQKRALLDRAFRAAGFPLSSGNTTFYIWQQGKPGWDGLRFASELLSLGIVVTPGAALTQTVDGVNAGQDYVRFALVPTLEQVAQAADRIRSLA